MCMLKFSRMLFLGKCVDVIGLDVQFASASYHTIFAEHAPNSDHSLEARVAHLGKIEI